MVTETNVPVDPRALEIDAPFVNKFQILVAGGNVRVAFAEGFIGAANFYRSAVVMTAQDARELAQAILASTPPPLPQGALSQSYADASGTPSPLKGLLDK